MVRRDSGDDVSLEERSSGPKPQSERARVAQAE
jgi:hypothetical protein